MNRIVSLIAVMLLVMQLLSVAQTRKLSGIINDPSTGEPLPGVNIVIEGTSKGTVTDVNGFYEIEAPVGATIRVSYIGYINTKFVVKPEKVDKSKPNILSKSEQPLVVQREINKPDSILKPKVFKHTIPDDPSKTLSPYFFVQSDDPTVDRLPLKATNAEVNIAGVIADVTIRQVYVNEGKNVLEAIYIFPGSARSAVYAMSMTIGTRRLYAKIKEKQQARQEYEQAKQDGKTATLLEQKRPNVFQMNVANILPGDTITVEMKYTELLENTKGVYEFVYPTVVGPRYSNRIDNDENSNDKWVANPYLEEGLAPTYSFDIKTNINAGMPIKEVTSPSHLINVRYTGKNIAKIGFNPAETNRGNSDFILRYRLSDNKVESGLLLYEHGDENFFLLMMQPPKAPTIDQIPPREYVFIVDVSGSMNGFPISVSKELMRGLLDKMRPCDRFNILLFAGGNALFSERSVPASKNNIDAGFSFIDKEQGGGGTEMYPAIERALKLPANEGFSRTFVVITDGYVDIERRLFQLIHKNLNRANMFAIGIGSSVNRFLIEGIANAGMGEPYVITNEGEAKIMGKRFHEYVENPVLTNIQLKLNNFEAYDIQPGAIPDVFSERPIILIGKYKGLPKGSIEVTGIAGNETYKEFFYTDSASRLNNQALRYLWARTKVRYLDDYNKFSSQARHGGEGDEEMDYSKMITSLGLQYSLLTQYTSFIAVDTMVRNFNKPITTVNQPLPLPKGVSNNAVGASVLRSTPVYSGDPSNISLSPDVQKLEEVVVVGYGTTKKSDLTGSVSSVSSENLRVSGNVGTALQGRVAGLNIVPATGNPGGNASIIIRGSATNQTGEPLYVVDGVPMSAANVQNITGGEIESVDVLKDASSTAIYGSRGSSGVIVINTKRAKEGHLKVEVSTNTTLDFAGKLPEMQSIYAQGQPSAGSLTWFGPESGIPYSWGPALSSLAFDGQPYLYDKNGRLVPQSNTYTTPAKAYNPYDLFKTGYSFFNNISISRGTAKNKWYASVSSTHKSDIIPGSSVNDYNLKFNSENKLFQYLKLSTSLVYYNQRSDHALASSDLTGVMYSLLTTPPSFDNSNGYSGKAAINNKETYTLESGLPRSYASTVNNPYGMVARNPFNDKLQRLTGSVSFSANLAKELTLTVGFNGDRYWNSRLFGADKNSAGCITGKFTDRNEDFRSFSSRASLSFNKNFGNNQFRMSIGDEWSLLSNKLEKTMYSDMLLYGIFESTNASNFKPINIDKERNGNRLFTSLGFDFNNYLFLNSSLSRDWSSTLHHPDGISASAGIAVNITNLNFLRNQNSLSLFKVFANYGKTLKESPLLSTNSYFNTIRYKYSDAVNYFERYEITFSPTLKPESVRAFNTGLSIGLFNNALTLEGLYYHRMSNNAIFATESNEQLVMLKNIGTIKYTGWEFSMHYQYYHNKFTFSTDVNFTRPRSKAMGLSQDMLSLAGFDDINTCLIEGQPLGVLYGTRFLRSKNGEMVIGSDGFPVVDSEKGIIGNPNPNWIINVSPKIRWKSMELALIAEWRVGGEVWNGTQNTMNYFGTSQLSADLRNTTHYIFNGVKPDGTANDIPVDFASASADISNNRWVRYGATGVAEEAIEDASWFKLREVRFTYNLPLKHICKLPIYRCSVTIFGRNLITTSKATGIDPETSLTGAENGNGLNYFNAPTTQSLGMGITFQF
jgi:TonB-linked SusC/RagA family outer membrane protein